MKKIIALALVLVMVLALCACGGSKSGPSGSYKLTGIKIDGEDYSSYISMLGYDSYTITFNSDGTGALTGDGSNISFKWNDTTIDDGSDKIPYTYTENSVSFETSGVEMTFTK